MTPNRVWEADEPGGVLDAIAIWFSADDGIAAVESRVTDAFAHRERVGYPFRVR